MMAHFGLWIFILLFDAGWVRVRISRVSCLLFSIFFFKVYSTDCKASCHHVVPIPSSIKTVAIHPPIGHTRLFSNVLSAHSKYFSSAFSLSFSTPTSPDSSDPSPYPFLLSILLTILIRTDWVGASYRPACCFRLVSLLSLCEIFNIINRTTRQPIMKVLNPRIVVKGSSKHCDELIERGGVFISRKTWPRLSTMRKTSWSS